MMVDWGKAAAALPGYELGTHPDRSAVGVLLAPRHRVLGRQAATEFVSAGRTEAVGFAAEAPSHAVRVCGYVEADGLHLFGLESGGAGG